jgi:hypothetical protein
MGFEKRIRALETRVLSDPLVLHFADGSTRQIRDSGDLLLTLLVGACRGDLSPRHAATLALIRESVSAEDPEGGHMIELLRQCPNGAELNQDDPNRDV